MRMTLTRDFYIPKDATANHFPQAGAIVYFYDIPGAKSGRAFGAVGFHGKANKPGFHYTFKTEERRAAYVVEYVQGQERTVQYRAERRETRKAPHSLTVGTILHTSWGYDQTNVEFFEVTRIVGPHTVELRELAQDSTETGFMCGKCKPIPGRFLSPRYEGDDQGIPIVRRANADGSVKISECRRAWVGAGEHYWSSYA